MFDAKGIHREKIAFDVTPTLNAFDTPLTGIAFGHSGGETLKINEQANTLNAQTGSETSAMIQGVISPTITTADSSRSKQDSSVTHQVGAINLTGYGVRRLTPTECERLQGFPDGWTGNFSDGIRYKMLGNAVTVNVARWIGRRIMIAEQQLLQGVM
jgi:site-specific DNA-cytosine methylase